jgi:hypothetical protein
MECPKCKAIIGFRQVQCTIIALNDTPGLSCFMCGYWFGVQTVRKEHFTAPAIYDDRAGCEMVPRNC